jgi:hypothetical protein
MRWRRTTFGALLVIAVAGLVVPTAASPASAAKPKRKTFSVRVATPVAGDANLAVVTFRGRLVGRPTLRTPRRLSPGLLAVAATRRLSGGRTQVWFGVLRRGPGATSRTLASVSGASQANGIRFDIRGEYTMPPNMRTSRHSNLFEWEDEPPATCDDPRNPRPIAQWTAEGRFALRFLWTMFLRALCDELQSAEVPRMFGIPHTAFSARLLSPNQIRISGPISVASTGTLVKRLPAGTYSLSGPDAARCSPGVQGTTHFVRCNVRKLAGASLDLLLIYQNLALTLLALAELEAGLFDGEGDFYGPDDVFEAQ